jgi:hypothetical protein
LTPTTRGWMTYSCMPLSLDETGLSVYYMPKAKIFLLSFERKFIKRGWEAGQGREGPGCFWYPHSCRGTGMRFIETCQTRG